MNNLEHHKHVSASIAINNKQRYSLISHMALFCLQAHMHMVNHMLNRL